jgi:nitroimidazol reductase NimA-like FMN-containing flavoprotein (pyridoxamine 5'-phosphate oxidase superfamily)/ribosomal protein S18 acetylase RimI-like enzyme
MSYEVERRVGEHPFQADAEWGLALFARAPCVHVAAVGDDGAPVMRTLTCVVLDGALCFHGGDHGEKLGLVDRQAVATCETIVAQVASYFVHAELACPASTYYESAHMRGVVRRVSDVGRKAAILSAIMERYQPEGGYLPISTERIPYGKVLEKLLVCELVPEHITAKRKLGQHRTQAQIERLLEGLWKRGENGDVAALRAIQDAHPDKPVPGFLKIAGASYVLGVAPNAEDARAVAGLLEGQYWTPQFTAEMMARAHVGTPAWVVARDLQGKVVGSARALSDQGRYAYLMDVIVRDDLRGKGIGQALTKLVLDHPQVRNVRAVGLRTKDAQTFYKNLRFEELVRQPGASDMVLIRSQS